ncbi:MAG: hypothetical protein GQ558_05790 [Thermoplasmata archaeon]|nr:hypothetical protein [Thermoplasmata archaeon]
MFKLEGKRAKKSDPKDWGRVVYKNYEALKWSQDHRLRGGRILLAIFLAFFIPVIIIEIRIVVDVGFHPAFLMMLSLPLIILGTRIYIYQIGKKVDQLPVIFEQGILYSAVPGVYIVRIFMPYTELKYIVRKKEWVMLYPRGMRGKYAFRIEELGEKGYEILMGLFDGTYSDEGPPKLNVYTEGGPIESHEYGE